MFGKGKSVGARLARDENDAVSLEPRRPYREQALLPQVDRQQIPSASSLYTAPSS